MYEPHLNYFSTHQYPLHSTFYALSSSTVFNIFLFIFFSRSLPPLILYFTSLPPTFYFFRNCLTNPLHALPVSFSIFFLPYLSIHTSLSLSLCLSPSLALPLSLYFSPSTLDYPTPLYLSLSDSSSHYHEYLSLYLSFYIDYLPEN